MKVHNTHVAAEKSTRIEETLETLLGLCCLFVVSPEVTMNNENAMAINYKYAK